MKISYKLGKAILLFINIILILPCLHFLGCKGISTEGIKVIVTTTLIETLVEQIGKERIDVVTIVPGGMCPGHFDIKPDDIAKLSRAKLLLSHGWEVWVPHLLNSIENEKPLTKILKIEGNWMIPDVQITAAEEITKTLCEVDPQNSFFYKKNLNQYKKEVNSLAVVLKKTDFQGKKIVCSKYQTGFLKWLGFEVVATYGGPESLTIKELTKTISIAKKENVQMVVDNLQSSSKVGKQIAEELGVTHITLTNFPLGNSYIESLKENINKIIQALR